MSRGGAFNEACNSMHRAQRHLAIVVLQQRYQTLLILDDVAQCASQQHSRACRCGSSDVRQVGCNALARNILRGRGRPGRRRRLELDRASFIYARVDLRLP